jgi:dTMP kinase
MNGKLIVLEGTDASGKSTQFACLCRKLEEEKKSFQRLVFPRYDQESSALIRMYLQGAFGSKPEDVNPYAASTFFAVDRFASYRSDWKTTYENGGLILADRYTTSNAIHQASKLEGEAQEAYLNWLFDFEYRLMELPKPDLVLFLDMPPLYEGQLLRDRTGKEEDIHEQDKEYLKKCYETASQIAQKENWVRIPCTHQRKIRTIAEIAADIWKTVEGAISPLC